MTYNLILLAGFILAFLNILQGLRRQGTAAFALNPAIWFSVFFVIIHVITASLKYSTGTWRYDYNYNYNAMINVALVSLIAYQPTVMIVSYAARRLTLRNLSIANHNRYVMPREHVGWFIYGVGLTCLVVGGYAAFQNYGLLDDRFLADRISAGFGQGLQRLLPNFVISSSIIFFYMYLSKSPELQRTRLISGSLAILSITIALIYYNGINSRNSIFLLFIILGSLYLFMRPAKSIFSGAFFRNAFLGGIAVLIAATVFFSMTRARYENFDSSYTAERLDKIGIYMLDGAFGNDENIVWMSSNNYTQHNGETYLAAFANFVPRSIWPEKPVGAGPRMKNEIFPGSYVLGAQGNSSITTGLLSEAWLNFGAWGVSFVLPIWALIALIFSNFISRNAFSIKSLPWITLVVLWSSLLIYAEFTGFVARSIFMTAPIFIVGFLGSRRQRLQFGQHQSHPRAQVRLQ